MSKTQFGSFSELLAMASEDLRPVMERLKSVILEVDPNAVEVVRLGDRAATYGLGPKKMIEGYTYILPHKSWVNLGFFRGSMLSDTDGLLEGTGKNMRHIKIRTVENADSPAIKEMIAGAYFERREVLG